MEVHGALQRLTGSGVAQSSMKALASGSEAMCSATDLLCARILARRATSPAEGSLIGRRLPQPLTFSWSGQVTSALVVVGSAGVMKAGASAAGATQGPGWRHSTLLHWPRMGRGRRSAYSSRITMRRTVSGASLGRRSSLRPWSGRSRVPNPASGFCQIAS